MISFFLHINICGCGTVEKHTRFAKGRSASEKVNVYRKSFLIALLKNPTREKYEKEAEKNEIIFIHSRLSIIFVLTPF